MENKETVVNVSHVMKEKARKVNTILMESRWYIDQWRSYKTSDCSKEKSDSSNGKRNCETYENDTEQSRKREKWLKRLYRQAKANHSKRFSKKGKSWNFRVKWCGLKEPKKRFK